MKRFTIIICISALLFCLSGCSRSGLFADHQNIERLLPVQTIGLDSQGTGVMMTVTSGTRPNGDPPLVLSALASGMETAIAQLQNYSPEDTLHYAHVQYILLGESAAQDGLEPILKWVEQNPDMRTDTAVFTIKGSASQAVTTTAGDTTDITELLAAMEREWDLLGRPVYSLREIASSLAERDAALCQALETVSSEGGLRTDTGATSSIIPAGYAVLSGDGLAGYLTQEQSLGADLLTGRASNSQATVEGNMLELLDAIASAEGQWNGGELTGITVHCHLRAGILEKEEGCETDLDRLRQTLADAGAQWLEDVLRCSQELSLDFLALGDTICQEAPGNPLLYMDRWTELFPTLPITVEVEAEIDRSYDLAQ